MARRETRPRLTRAMLDRALSAALSVKHLRTFVKDPRFILRVALAAALDPAADVKAITAAALSDEPLEE